MFVLTNASRKMQSLGLAKRRWTVAKDSPVSMSGKVTIFWGTKSESLCRYAGKASNPVRMRSFVRARVAKRYTISIAYPVIFDSLKKSSILARRVWLFFSSKDLNADRFFVKSLYLQKMS